MARRRKRSKTPPMKGGGAPTRKNGKGHGFVTQYVHAYTGKVMRAQDYGYKAWPFGNREAA